MDTPTNSDKLNPDQQQQLLFMMLIQQHQQIAMMGMGKIKNPSTDEIERDLKSAKFAIDTLNVLEEYTKGNLPEDLKNYLTQTLTNLRINYADEKKKGDEPQESGQKDQTGEKDETGKEQDSTD
ncbi:MAG: DUF1844 domain-containing protein [Balneolaceae bacterium]